VCVCVCVGVCVCVCVRACVCVCVRACMGGWVRNNENKGESGVKEKMRRREEEGAGHVQCKAGHLTTGSSVVTLKHKCVQLGSNLLVSQPHPLVILGDQ